MDESEKLLQLLRESLDEFRKANSLSAATLAKLDRAVKDNTKAQEEQTDQAMEAAKAMEKFKDTTRAVLSGLGSAAQGARENREDFRSLKPAVGAAGTALKSMTGGLGSAIGVLGNVITGLSTVGRLLGPVGKVASLIGAGVGVGVSAIGDAIKKHGKDVVDAGTAFMNFSLDETQRVVGAFQEISKIGGVTGNSFQGLQQAALQTGLSMDSFARVIAKNSQGLAFAGGSVTQGMRAVVDITKASKGFEDQFLKLGIGFEEQRDLTAQFLGYQRSQTGVNLRDTRALTESSKAYILQLDELARLTGMSRQEAASRLEQQNRELKFGAVLDDAGKRGKEYAAAINNAALIIEKRAGPQMARGFKDIFDNMGTKEAQVFFQATGGAGPELVQFLERTGDLATFMERLQQATKAQYEAMGGTKYERQVGRLGTYFDPVLGEMRQLTNATDMTVEGIRAVGEEQNDAKNNQSRLTKNVVGAQKSLRDFAVGIDSVVVQQFPKMAGAVKMFTDSLAAGAGALDKILGTGITRGTAPPGGARSAASPAFAGSGARPGGTSEDYLSRIARLESGGRNIGNVPRAGQQATSAFGLYQITKKTFEGLVANAPPGSALKGKTFEDMKSDVNLQTEAMKQLTSSNEQLLARRGLSTSDAAKYMAHMMGYGTASRILEAPGDTPLGRLVPQEYLDKNNLAMYRNAGQLREHFDRITGGRGYQYGGIASGPKSGYAAMLHGTEAVVPLAGGRSIPVEMTGMTDTMGQQVTMMGEQLNRFDTMIGLLQNNVDISRRLLSATR